MTTDLEMGQPQPKVWLLSVVFGLVSVFFSVYATELANTRYISTMSFQILSDWLMFGKVKFYYLLAYVVGTLVQKWLQGMVYHSLFH